MFWDCDEVIPFFEFNIESVVGGFCPQLFWVLFLCVSVFLSVIESKITVFVHDIVADDVADIVFSVSVCHKIDALCHFCTLSVLVFFKLFKLHKSVWLQLF